MQWELVVAAVFVQSTCADCLVSVWRGGQDWIEIMILSQCGISPCTPHRLDPRWIESTEQCLDVTTTRVEVEGIEGRPAAAVVTTGAGVGEATVGG